MDKLLAAVLVAGLGADDYMTRDWSDHGIRFLLNHADFRVPLLLAATSPDPEVRYRARGIAADFESLLPTCGHFPRLQDLPTGGLPPELLALHESHLRHIQEELDGFHFRGRSHPGYRTDCTQRELCGQFALSCLRAGVSRRAVDHMLVRGLALSGAPVEMPDAFTWDGN